MAYDSLEDLKVKFEIIFANLPERVRDEDIIVVLDKKPYTWNSVFFEIKNDTLLGKKMLKKLGELKLI